MQQYNRSFEEIVRKGKRFTVLALPNSGVFKLAYECRMGSNCEEIYKDLTGKNVFGLSHLVEHLSFKSTKHYTTRELKETLRSYGMYNAGTNTDYINYFFITISEKYKLAIQLILDIALNDLSKVTEDEFLLERKVVSNEALMYNGNKEYKFNRNANTIFFGKDIENDIIGISNTIDKFELKDAKELKANFINCDDTIINITYDPVDMGINEIINEILDRMEEYEKPKINTDMRHLYLDKLKQFDLVKVDTTIESVNDQILTRLAIRLIEEPTDEELVTSWFLIPYITKFARGKNLDYLIREERGLTYNVSFNVLVNIVPNNISLYFSSGVTEGDEELLLSLFKSTIALNLKEFDTEDFKHYLEKEKISDKLDNLNLNNYSTYHDYPIIYRSIYENNKIVFSKDVGLVAAHLLNKYVNEKTVIDLLTRLNNLVTDGEYSIIRSKKIK